MKKGIKPMYGSPEWYAEERLIQDRVNRQYRVFNETDFKRSLDGLAQELKSKYKPHQHHFTIPVNFEQNGTLFEVTKLRCECGKEMDR